MKTELFRRIFSLSAFYLAFSACAFALGDPFGAGDGEDEPMGMEFLEKNSEESGRVLFCGDFMMDLAAAMESYLGYGFDALTSQGCLCYLNIAPPSFLAHLPEPRDPRRAFALSEKLASVGAPSMFSFFLVNAYVHGIGTKKDYAKAFEIMERLAGSREPETSLVSCVYLAYAYEKGLGVEKDLKKASDYREKFNGILSTEGHHMHFLLVDIAKYFYGGFVFPKDRDAALSLLAGVHEYISKQDVKKYEGRTFEVLKLQQSALSALVNIYDGDYDESDRDAAKAAKYRSTLEQLSAQMDKLESNGGD